MFFFFHRFLRVDFRLVSRTHFSFVSEKREGNPGIPLDFNVPVSFAYVYIYIYYDIEDRTPFFTEFANLFFIRPIVIARIDRLIKRRNRKLRAIRFRIIINATMNGSSRNSPREKRNEKLERGFVRA